VIRINLLPQRRRRRRRFAPESGVVTVVLLVVAGLVLAYLYGEVRNTRVKVETDQIHREIEAIRPKVAEILALEKQIEALRAKEELLKTLEAREIPWADLLADLAQRTPQDAWLASATFAPSQAGTLYLQGSGFSYNAVARFMTNLAGSKFYSDIDLSQAQKTEVGRRTVIQFGIYATLRSTAVTAQGGTR
jgi:type IV pilus assembly protein PilN